MLGTLFPELCNQQGDQGFLDTCDQLGISTTVVTSTNHLKDLKFLYVGDSSITGERLLLQRVEKLIPKIRSLVENGLVLFTVGRSAIAMAKLLDQVSISGSVRVSKFQSVKYLNMELLGYVNGAYSSVFEIQQVGSGWFVQTALLGPCLVINPQLRNAVFEKAGLATTEITELESLLREHYRKEIS